MTIKFQICLYFFFLSIGCQTKTHEGITIPVDNNKLTAQITDLFSTINIIPLETQDSTLISSTDKITAYRDRIFVLDKMQHTLFVFDTTGKFVWKLYKLGRGPQEYVSLEDMVINPRTGNIEVLSPIGQYIIYDSDGNFLQKYNIPVKAVHAFFPIDDDLTAFYEQVKGKLFVYSKAQGKIINEKPMSEEFILRYTPYQYIITPFNYFHDEVFFLAADQKKVFKISPETGEITEQYAFHFGEQDHNLRTLPNDQEMMYYLTENKDLHKIYCISNFKETQDYMVVYYIYEKFWHTTFYNKATQTATTFNKPSGIMIFYPFDCNEQFLMNIVSANIIERQIKKEWVSQQEWDKIQQIPMDANPIVLKYNFKSH